MEAHLRLLYFSFTYCLFWAEATASPISKQQFSEDNVRNAPRVLKESIFSALLSTSMVKCHLKDQYTRFMQQYINIFSILLFIHVFLWN